MNKIVIAFIPVIHRGYLDFLAQSGATDVYLLSVTDVPELPHLAREIRALSVDEAKQALAVFGYTALPFGEYVEAIKESATEICMPDEDITRTVCAKHFQGRPITFAQSFLRWDWKRSVGVTESVIPDADRVVRREDSSWEGLSRCMRFLFEEAAKSSDWWRQIAAMAATRGGEILVAYNHHLPHEYVPYFDGDPRNNFGPGEYIEIATSLHAEIALITEAARRGISLEGADLYVSVFPCGGCAGAVSVSGVRRVFFSGGYSNLNGVKNLRDRAVELVYLEL